MTLEGCLGEVGEVTLVTSHPLFPLQSIQVTTRSLV